MKHSRPALLSVCVATLLSLAAGCGDKADPPASSPGAPAQQSESSSAGRLAAALAISDTIKRDNALGAVADFAGQAGDAEAVKMAVLQIRDTIKRDHAADSAALALAKAGKRTDAATVARMMGDTVKRDNTLSKLAEK